jgi:hypothetical protein
MTLIWTTLVLIDHEPTSVQIGLDCAPSPSPGPITHREWEQRAMPRRTVNGQVVVSLCGIPGTWIAGGCPASAADVAWCRLLTAGQARR